MGFGKSALLGALVTCVAITGCDNVPRLPSQPQSGGPTPVPYPTANRPQPPTPPRGVMPLGAQEPFAIAPPNLPNASTLSSNPVPPPNPVNANYNQPFGIVNAPHRIDTPNPIPGQNPMPSVPTFNQTPNTQVYNQAPVNAPGAYGQLPNAAGVAPNNLSHQFQPNVPQQAPAGPLMPSAPTSLPSPAGQYR